MSAPLPLVHGGWKSLATDAFPTRLVFHSQITPFRLWGWYGILTVILLRVVNLWFAVLISFFIIQMLLGGSFVLLTDEWNIIDPCSRRPLTMLCWFRKFSKILFILMLFTLPRFRAVHHKKQCGFVEIRFINSDTRILQSQKCHKRNSFVTSWRPSPVSLFSFLKEVCCRRQFWWEYSIVFFLFLCLLSEFCYPRPMRYECIALPAELANSVGPFERLLQRIILHEP